MRKSILEELRETLKDKVLEEDYIFVNDSRVKEIEDLPVIDIISISESVDSLNVSPREYDRTLFVNIECKAVGNDYTEAYLILESMIESVEQLIESSCVLNGFSKTTMLNGIEYDFEAQGQSPVAGGVMRYAVRRKVMAQDFDETCFDTLKRVEIKYKVKDNNEDNDTDSEQHIENLEQ